MLISMRKSYFDHVDKLFGSEKCCLEACSFIYAKAVNTIKTIHMFKIFHVNTGLIVFPSCQDSWGRNSVLVKIKFGHFLRSMQI